MKSLPAVALILLCAVPLVAGAADPGSLNATIGGGLNVPAADEAGNGYTLAGGLGYHVLPALVVGAEAAYLGYTNDHAATGGGADYSKSRSFFEYVASAKYVVGTGRFAPYAKGFCGGYSFTMDRVVDERPADFTESGLAFGGGLGLLVRGAEGTNLYVEALAHQFDVEAGKARLVTFTVGMDLSFLP